MKAGLGVSSADVGKVHLEDPLFGTCPSGGLKSPLYRIKKLRAPIRSFTAGTFFFAESVSGGDLVLSL